MQHKPRYNPPKVTLTPDFRSITASGGKNVEQSILASELYAITQGSKCEGTEECHYCAGPCKTFFPHGEVPPPMGVKRSYIAKRVNNPYICMGCWLWRRKSITVQWLDGTIKDRQTPPNHSWLLVDDMRLNGDGKNAWVIDTKLHPSGTPKNEQLYQKLLNPPTKFSLSFIEFGAQNHIQLCTTNEVVKVEAATPLSFTVNGLPFIYTIQELDHALRHGPQGMEPGVQALVRLLGPSDLFTEEERLKREAEKNPKMGRPPALLGGQSTKKVIGASGVGVSK